MSLNLQEGLYGATNKILKQKFNGPFDTQGMHHEYNRI